MFLMCGLRSQRIKCIVQYDGRIQSYKYFKWILHNAKEWVYKDIGRLRKNAKDNKIKDNTMKSIDDDWDSWNYSINK